MISSPFYKPQIFNLFIAFSLVFFSATVRSLNIFTVPIEILEPRLTSIWSRGLAIDFLVYSLGTFISIPYLKRVDINHLRPGEEDNKTQLLSSRLKRMSCIMATMYLSLLLAVPAIKIASSVLLILALIPQGLPYAYFFLVGLHALMTWLPHNPGLAMSITTIAYGASQYSLTPMLHKALSVLGVEYSLIVTSTITFALAFSSAMVLEFPSEYDIKILIEQDQQNRLGKNPSLSSSDMDRETEYAEIVRDDEERQNTHNCHGASEIDENHPWQSLLKLGKFYRFMVLIFVGRTSMALIAYYFKLGSVFGLDTSVMVQAYQILSIASMVWMCIVSTLFERVSRLFGPIAIRPSLASIFAIQAVLYIALIHVSMKRHENPFLALLFVSLIVVVLETHKLFNVIKAGCLFGREHAMVVFGLASGITIGPAGSLFTLLLSVIEKWGSQNNSVSTPETFIPFYYVSSVCCLIGTVLALIE